MKHSSVKIVERLKLISQAPDGRMLEGMALRLVQSPGDAQWP